jgi:GTP-binding protein
MIPVIAIVGRPNVGKSTLFNCLTQQTNAIVADEPGVTRDRLYGTAQYHQQSYIFIDTGGIGMQQASDIEGMTLKQALQAINESHLVLFVVDARAGLVPEDILIAKQLRKLSKSIILVINKTDGLDSNIAASDFHRLGFERTLCISAAHRQNISQLYPLLPVLEDEEESEKLQGVKIAIVGKPNAGKSTLVNRMLGEERVIVLDMPGTTRESVYINLERQGKHYVLIDTAGVRRKSHVVNKVEKISVVKTLQAVEDGDVIIFLIDARNNISEQDLHLLGFIIEAGKALIIAVNKWDGLSLSQRENVKYELERRLSFTGFAKIKFISALHGTGVGELFPDVESAYESATKKISTPKLTELLQKAVIQHSPPMVKHRRIKLRYAHSGGQNPQVIVIHGNQTKKLPASYLRYLQGFFRERLKLFGAPIRLELKESDNPYKPSTENKPKFIPHPKAPIRRKRTQKYKKKD